MSNLHDETRDPLESIDFSVSDIKVLARSFSNIGQENTGNILKGIADEIEYARKHIREAIDKEIHARFCSSKEAMSNVLTEVVHATTEK